MADPLHTPPTFHSNAAPKSGEITDSAPPSQVNGKLGGTETVEAAGMRSTRALNALLLESSRDCIVGLDLEGRMTFVSPGGLAAIEMDDATELIGRSWLKVWQGADRDIATAAVAAARNGTEGRFQAFLPTAKGTPRWWDVAISPLPGADGTPESLVSVGRDITEMKLAQLRLEASEAQFRAFAQAMPHHVWTSPPDGQLDWFNERAYSYSGATEGELSGTGWVRLVHPDDVALAGQRWAAAIADGTPYETEFRLRRADGEYRWHLARAVPIRTADGTVTRWIGTNTDIAEQKKTEAALAHLNAFLERQTAEQAARSSPT